MNSKKNQKQSYPTKEGIVFLPKLQANLHESVIMNKGRVPYQGLSLPMRKNMTQASSSTSIQQLKNLKGGDNYISNGVHQQSSLRLLSQNEGKERQSNALKSKQKLPSHHSLSYQSIANASNRHAHLGSLDTLDLRPHNQSTFSTLQQPSKNSIQTDQQHEYVRRNNPSMLLLQHNQCKNENRERLKHVKNLEDLINFKVVTIADKFQQEQDQLNAISQADNSTMGGPLSPNYNRSLMTNQQEVLTENSLLSPRNNQMSIMATQATQHGAASVSQATSLNVLKRICDPLLANSSLPKIKFGANKQKKQINKVNSKLINLYEIPEDLKRMPQNYNSMTQMIPLNTSFQLPNINLKNVMHIDERNSQLSPRENGSEGSLERFREDQGDKLIMNLKSYFAEREQDKPKLTNNNCRAQDQLKPSLSLQRKELMKLYKLEELKYQQNQSVINSQLDLFHQILNNDLNHENHQLASFETSETAILEQTNEQLDDELSKASPLNQDSFIKNLMDSSNQASAQLRFEFENRPQDDPKVRPRFSSIKQIQSVKINNGYVNYTQHQIELMRQMQNQNQKKLKKETSPRAGQNKPNPKKANQTTVHTMESEKTMPNIVLLTKNKGQPQNIFDIQPKQIGIISKHGSSQPTGFAEENDNYQHRIKTDQGVESPEDGMAISLHEYIMKQEKENLGERVRNQPEKLDLFLSKDGENPVGEDKKQPLPLNIELNFADQMRQSKGYSSTLPGTLLNTKPHKIYANETLLQTLDVKSSTDGKKGGAASPSEASTIKQSARRLADSELQNLQKEFNEESAGVSRSDSKHMIIIQGQNVGDTDLNSAKALKSSFPVVKQNDNITKNMGTGVDSRDSLLSSLTTQKSKITIIPNATNLHSERTNANGAPQNLANVAEPHLSQPISTRDNSLSPRIIKYVGINTPTQIASPDDNSMNQTFNVVHVPVANSTKTKIVKQAEKLQVLDNMIYDEIINDHLIKRAQWIPSRFNKFPRFGKSTQKQTEMEKQFIKMRQFISLNPHITNLLNQGNITFIMNMLEIPNEKQKEILALTPPNQDLEIGAGKALNLQERERLQKENTRPSGETNYDKILKTAEKINLSQQVAGDPKSTESLSASNEPSFELRKTLASKHHDNKINIQDTQSVLLPPADPLATESNRSANMQGTPQTIIRMEESSKIERIEEKPLTQKQIDNLIQIIKMNLDTYPNNLPEEPHLGKNSILSTSNKVVHNRFQKHQLNESNQKRAVMNQKLYAIPNEKQKTEQLDIQGRKQLISRLQEMSGKKIGEVRMQNSMISIKVQNQSGGRQESSPESRQMSFVEVANGGAEAMKKSFVIEQLLESARERSISRVVEEEQKVKSKGRYLGPTTQAKYEKTANKPKFPMAVLDMTAGHTREEPGYGYLRPRYVIDRNEHQTTKPDLDNSMVFADFHNNKNLILDNENAASTPFYELELVLQGENTNQAEEKANHDTKRILKRKDDNLMINSHSQQNLGKIKQTPQGETLSNLSQTFSKIQATEIPTNVESHRNMSGIAEGPLNTDMFQIYPQYMHREPRFKDPNKFQEQMQKDQIIFRQSLQNAQQVKQSTHSAFMLSGDMENTAVLPSDDGYYQYANKVDQFNLKPIPEKEFEATINVQNRKNLTFDSDQIQSVLQDVDSSNIKQFEIQTKLTQKTQNNQTQSSQKILQNNLQQNQSYTALDPIKINKVQNQLDSLQEYKLSSMRTPKLPASIRLKNNQNKAAKKILTDLKAANMQNEQKHKAQEILNKMHPDQAHKIREQVIELGLNLQQIKEEEEIQLKTIETVNSLLKRKSQAEVIKGLIDQMYLQEKKYQSSSIQRRDLLQTNDLIFNLERSHLLSNKDQNLKNNSESERLKISLQQPMENYMMSGATEKLQIK